MIKFLYKLFGFAENKCDQIKSDYLYFRFTNKCCNRCKFCVDRFTVDRGDACLENIVSQSKKFPGKTINITGGEPFLFPKKLLKYVEEMSKTNRLVLNTSLPKGAFDDKETTFKVFELIDVVDISFHGNTNDETDVAFGVPARYDKLSFIKELCSKFKNKITVSCVLKKGGIDSYEKFQKRISIFKQLGCKRLYFNELNGARGPCVSDDDYVSIQEILGNKITFKSAYSYGCHTELLNYDGTGIDVHIRRQCYRSGSTIPPTWKDVLKEFINLFNVNRAVEYQLYEDGSISDHRSYDEAKLKRSNKNEDAHN